MKTTIKTAILKFFVFCSLSFFISTVQAQPTIFFKPLVQHLNNPICVTNAGDGSGRLFIVEVAGLIKIYKNGAVLPKPFIDLTNFTEQRILSIAFHPKYKKNRTFYVYTDDQLGTITLSLYKASKQNPDSAILSSGQVLYSRKSPSGRFNHNTGDLHFGKDGYLYVSLGDGDGQGDPNNQSQNGQLFSGKMLRLNVDVPTPPYYSIPPDNPFISDPNIADEIWALGLRNPFRWSFDRKNGDLWIGDVGQDRYEEIDYRKPAQSAGVNYGWRCYEGDSGYNTTACGDRGNYVFPIFTYPHDNIIGNSVTGGYVYRGAMFPGLYGNYICADYVAGQAWTIKAARNGTWNTNKQTTGVPTSIVGFGEGEDAELYAVSFDSTLYQVQTAASFVADKTNTQVTKITANNNNLKSSVYPTFVTNSALNIELKEVYKFVRIVNMSGQEFMRKTLDKQTGDITIHLPKLEAGMYIVQLVGANVLEKKIYVSQ